MFQKQTYAPWVQNPMKLDIRKRLILVNILFMVHPVNHFDIYGLWNCPNKKFNIVEIKTEGGSELKVQVT